MLFAVEGGGFFSSSASGYSKGLTLLLLGQKKEEKPMRVAPWNQYQLVDHDTDPDPDPDLQLASGKERLVRGCASFVCFSRTAAGLESPCPLKVEPARNQEVLPGPPVFDVSTDKRNSADCENDEDDDSKKRINNLKSSLKKAVNINPDAANGNGGDPPSENSCEQDSLGEKNADVPSKMEGRKVQWTDTTGGELFEIREFEMSEYGSDDEFDHRNQKTCSCSIM